MFPSDIIPFDENKIIHHLINVCNLKNNLHKSLQDDKRLKTNFKICFSWLFFILKNYIPANSLNPKISKHCLWRQPQQPPPTPQHHLLVPLPQVLQVGHSATPLTLCTAKHLLLFASGLLRAANHLPTVMPHHYIFMAPKLNLPSRLFATFPIGPWFLQFSLGLLTLIPVPLPGTCKMALFHPLRDEPGRDGPWPLRCVWNARVASG